MTKRNAALEAEMTGVPPQKTGKRFRSSLWRFLRRFLLLLVTLVIMLSGAMSLFLHTVLTGPSPIARDRFTLFLLEDSRTDWIPGLFLDEALVREIAENAEG